MTLAQIRKDPRVDEVDDEGSDGIWIYLKKGYYNPESECHIIHEHTIAECLVVMKGIEINTGQFLH